MGPESPETRSAEGGFRDQVSFVMLGTHDGVPARDLLEHRPVGFVADALLLDREAEEGFGAQVNLGSELGNNHEAFGVVEPLQ